MAIDNRKIRNLEQIIQYRFSQPDLAWEALRAANPYDPAPATENMPSAADGNSGLAIVGQAVMNHELAVEWYHDVKLPGHGSVSRGVYYSSSSLFFFFPQLLSLKYSLDQSLTLILTCLWGIQKNSGKNTTMSART